jgi:cell division protein ZipA
LADFRWQLFWILLGLGVSMIAGIVWWGSRRSQAPGNAELRGSSMAKAPDSVPSVAADEEQLPSRDGTVQPEMRDWGVPPFEPLSIRTAEFDRIPVLDRPMMVDPDATDVSEPASERSGTMRHSQPAAPPPSAAIAPSAPAPPPSAPPPAPPPAVRLTAEHGDRFAAATAPIPNASELQKIVTIRVCAAGAASWPGARLIAALERHGLAFGRYQVFHRKHVDGRTLFCVASLVEPGSFDIAHVAQQEHRGVTLFAVLPGPAEPLQTLDALIATALGLAEELSGMVQDAKGVALSPQRAAALRDEVVRFQALLPTH